MIRFEVYQLMKVYIMLVWFMTTCGLVEVSRFFIVILPPNVDGGNIFNFFEILVPYYHISTRSLK